MKSEPCDVTFIVIELSETPNSFMKTSLLLEIKKVASFIKTRFYWKRSCIKMHKHSETFDVNKGYKLSLVAFIPTSPFLK